MGNVLASSAPPPAPPVVTQAVPETGVTKLEPVTAESNNPGCMEDLHKKCKGLY